MNQGTTPQLPATAHSFTQRLSSTRRGARLARLLAAEQLRTWPVSPDIAERAELIVGELAANAALHGRVQGRDFRLTLTLDEAAGPLRIEVTDTRGEKLPVLQPPPPPDHESGRGLLLVAALADRWGTVPNEPVGKTAWAALDLGTRPQARPSTFDCDRTETGESYSPGTCL
ncbi:ATP-binding protein [Streptomyces sp. NBS 14/10]|uniref:ATP-binding protein n=1 Tax=Streptomyces sp. NBS 14/10 TaxID=1945643 RepID=UPI000B7DA902|nr:ATP-binding protein [Streptomyces sp. NBS 14/10]KAK1183194.1 ATP-binding protein [Streptomyces sp. NBS 14/10]